MSQAAFFSSFFFSKHLTKEESGKVSWKEPAAEQPSCGRVLVANGVDSGEEEEEEEAGTCSTRADGERKNAS